MANSISSGWAPAQNGFSARAHFGGTAEGSVSSSETWLFASRKVSGVTKTARMLLDATPVNAGITLEAEKITMRGLTSGVAAVRVDGALGIKDGMTAPSAESGQALLYVDSADGDLKIRFADGKTKTIVTDT
jgi:hypothetical protein